MYMKLNDFSQMFGKNGSNGHIISEVERLKDCTEEDAA